MSRVDDLLTAAQSQTGLDDFGGDAFREGLERLVRALDEEARLNAAGEAYLHRRIVELLGQRLQVEDWYRRHPEIDDEPITTPLIGLGLPRTGSTALSFLLAADPGIRYLRQWEATAPCPPPSSVVGADPRIASAELAMEQHRRNRPRGAALVPSAATGPMECHDLMALDFKAQSFHAFARVPSYSMWILHDADLTPTYHYVRRVLKLLQWGAPVRTWRLKNPTHLLWLDFLDQAFPDAKFWMTHRDPTEVIVSVADLYAEVQGRFSDDVDLGYIGEVNVAHWSVGMERALAFRDRGADKRFYDLHFRAVQRDPVGEVKGLYEWLGEPVTDDFEGAMQEWWAENAARREQNVHPDPAIYGIDLDHVRTLFARYAARIPEWTAHDRSERREPGIASSEANEREAGIPPSSERARWEERGPSGPARSAESR